MTKLRQIQKGGTGCQIEQNHKKTLKTLEGALNKIANSEQGKGGQN